MPRSQQKEAEILKMMKLEILKSGYGAASDYWRALLKTSKQKHLQRQETKADAGSDEMIFSRKHRRKLAKKLMQ